jgi:hypothetical protein
MDLESDFLKNSIGRNIITIGSINSGKSYCALHYLFHALQNNMFDSYHIVAPHYKSEQNGSYKFIENFKDKCYIYTQYDPIIAQHIDELRYKKSVFFLIDDSTGVLAGDMLQTDILKLFSTCRHGCGLTSWIVTHAAKIAKKNLRALTTYTFITNILSEKVLQDVYEDFLSIHYKSMKKNYKDFFNDYENMIQESKHPQMLIARNTNGRVAVDFKVDKWNCLQIDLSKIEKPKPQPKPQPKQTVNRTPNFRVQRIDTLRKRY